MTWVDARSAQDGAEAPNRDPKPTRPQGHSSGSSWLKGWPFDPSEHTAELAWPLNVAVYDKMRRSEATIKSIYNAVTLPIRRTAWRIDPNGAPDEVVSLIAGDMNLPVLGRDDLTPSILRRRKRFDWTRHVATACLELIYGHMPFEIVGAIDDTTLLWHLTRLEERMPQTLYKINSERNGDLTSVQQWPTGAPGDIIGVGTGIEIPSEHMVYYCHEREGGLWQGNSALRTSYGNFLIKGRLIRVDALKHERNGMGIPWFEAPEGATPAMLADLDVIASRIRAGENVGGSAPYGARLHLAGVEGTLPDTIGSVRYHDEQMGVEMLTQFLQLGKTAHGSRALGDTLAEFFVMALQSVADEIANTVNEQLIEQWVDWNWGDTTPSPLIRPGEIGEDHSITGEALSALVQSGALESDPELDKWIRENYRMPARDPSVPWTARGAATPTFASGVDPYSYPARRRARRAE